MVVDSQFMEVYVLHATSIGHFNTPGIKMYGLAWCQMKLIYSLLMDNHLAILTCKSWAVLIPRLHVVCSRAYT